MHHAAEAVTSIYWNRRSDHVGRKPVLLIGLAGTIVSIIWFGLSRSFWMLLLRYDNSSGRDDSLSGVNVPLTYDSFSSQADAFMVLLRGTWAS
jgi:MFS family permease